MDEQSKSLTIKDLIVAGVFGAMILVVGFLLGSALLMATGIPATGSVANMLAATFIAVVGLKIIDKFGAATVMFATEGAISIPTLINGPPGVHKVVLLLIAGLVADIILLLTKRSDRGYLFMGGALSATMVVLIYLSLVVLGFPGDDALRPILIPLVVVSGIMGGTGAFIGIKVYESKLKNLSVVQRLKS